MSSARRGADWILLGAVVALLILGAEMVYSASFVVAHNEFHDDLYFLSRQVVWILVGAIGMALAARSDYHAWSRFAFPFMAVCVLALVVVLIPGFGVTNYGAQRWLYLGPLPAVQPSEFAKLALVLYMANWLARKGRQVSEFTYGAVPFAILVGLVAGLVELEPDLGTTIVLVATATCVFFVAGANLLHFLLGITLAVLAGLWFIFNASYRVERVSAFLDPWKDEQGTGWHTIQTLIALGSGGLAGLGLGASRQKFYYLPNAHTDAIYAIIGEELGLIGTLGVLILFGVIAWRGFLAAARAPDTYGRLLATGATSMITLQALLNIAVTTNSAPYTGVTLPFVSFGGSSIVVSMVAVGLIVSVSRRGPRPEGISETPTLAGRPERPFRARARLAEHRPGALVRLGRTAPLVSDTRRGVRTRRAWRG